MARKLILLLASAGALAVPAVASAAGFEARDPGQRYVPGEALVRFEPGTAATERRELRSAADVEFEKSLSLPRAQLVSFDGSVRQAITRLEDQPGVLYAQPNYRYHALAAAPNDSHFGNLWGLGGTPGVGALPAWDRSRGAGQVIAVVDTGVDLTHPDLTGNLWTGPGGTHGHDFVDNDDIPDDYNLHGTHVAGTAAAIAGNGIGVAGVAPQAQIMAVRSLDGDGSGNTSQIANGIVFAANNGASVINLSLGSPGGGPGDQAMSDAITQAEQKNAVVVAAAGNDDNNNDANPTSPCTLPNANLICVAAVTKSGARSDFSNFGATTVDLGAPGGDGSGVANQDILSAKPSWAAPSFSDNFESGLGKWTPLTTAGLAWGIEDGVGIGGPGGHSAADSPAALYENDTDSQLQATAATNLTGKRGCRLDFFLGLADVEQGFDFVGIGIETGAGITGQLFTGDSGNSFERVEMSMPEADGRSDVKPTFAFMSDGAVVGDGAYIDNLNLLCRGNSYPNTIADDSPLSGGDYTAIAGTSMASPHVAGVAALVRAVDPGASPSQVVQALRTGAKPVAAMAGVTVTGGVVDAVGAMDATLAIPNPQPPGPTPPNPPGKARFGSVSVSKRGVLTIKVSGDPGTSGVMTLTANIARSARVRTIARKSFQIGGTGRASVKLKLSRAALKQLKRKRKLRVRAKVVLRNAAGLSSTTTAGIRISLRRR